MSRRRDLGRALLACIDERSRNAFPTDMEHVVRRADVERLLELAGRHRVLPYLYLGLRRVEGVDLELLASLERSFATQTARHLQATADLAALKEALDPADVPWLVVKGPVLAELFYPEPTLRSFFDLDILVHRPEYARAVEALESAGFEVRDRNWDLIVRERRGQLHVVLRLGTTADLHWHLVNREPVRNTLEVSMDGLFERARPARLSGLDVRTLGRSDTLVHLCLHAALAGGNRLLWLKDVERVVAVDGPDWDEAAALAASWGAGPLVAVILERARRLLGAAVPDEPLERMDGSRVRRGVTRSLDRLWPVERARSSAALPAIWTQALRPGWGATLRALSRRLVRPIRLRAGDTSDAVGRHGRPPPVEVPSGGPEARAGFLRMVVEDRAPGA